MSVVVASNILSLGVDVELPFGDDIEGGGDEKRADLDFEDGAA